METTLTFSCDGLTLAGTLHVPDDLRPGERRPAFVVLAGFGGTQRNAGVPAATLAARGYVALRFDHRGCGKSEGEHARVICLERVADTRAALDLLASRPEVDAD